MNSSSKLILTDIDDVVLRWADAFTAWVKGAVDPNIKPLPEGSIHPIHNVGRWLGISDTEGYDLLMTFHHSAHYTALQPYADALTVLPRLHAKGHRLISITACGLTDQIFRARHKNLEAVFGSLFDEVIPVEAGGCKRDVLARFAPAVWVEDSLRNAEDGARLGHRSFLITRPINQADRPDPAVTRVTGWHAIARALEDDKQTASFRNGLNDWECEALYS